MGQRRSRPRRHWTLLLFVVLSLVLIGAKGCKKKKPKGFGSAQASTGEVYWYYIGDNNWGSSLWGGALWCQSAEPNLDHEPYPTCGSDDQPTFHADTATITCNGPGYTIQITCGYGNQ